ncbi:MAG: hypothetical protein K8S13_07060 [Desulfobacula sp.]|uniref:hypothetical protein n=1 Tax=Desulfobacula sp. TaxID=2593537 RepID=UPI0025BF6763|nr:hypothetical protein [Desulfobacula sp.]MCD4719607.1 hypothetical protein [Desulfobacula sp.]
MIRFKFSCMTTILLCFVLSLPVFAEPGKIVPFVSIKQEYSDNILFSSSNEEEDFITTATAGVIYFYDSERVDAKLDGRLYHLFYWDNDQLDSTDGSVSGNWDYQVTERVGVGAAANYRNDSRRDMDTNITGLLLSGDREAVNFSVSSNYMFSEVTRGEATFTYGWVEIDEINDDEDNDTIRLNLSFSKNLSKTFKNTMGLLDFSYLHYTADLENISTATPGMTTYRDFTSDVLQLYTGFSRDITELYNVYLQIGASYTDTTESQRINQTILKDQSTSSFGGVLASGLNYDGLYYDVGFSISHDVRGGSGTNGTVERSAVSLGIDRKVSDDFFITFDTSCYLNRNDRETQADLDELTINIQPGFRYKFFDTFTLTGVYRYTIVENRQNDTTSERNMVYLMIRKDFDL